MLARWQLGAAEVQELIDRGDLQKLVGEAANGTRLLRKASRTLQTSGLALESDPDSAFVLAYDATRQALTALLAQQGLRPTSVGGHFAVEQSARAQFGAGFRAFGALRRRRNELEYPRFPGEGATVGEAADAAVQAGEMIGHAQALLPDLGLF